MFFMYLITHQQLICVINCSQILINFSVMFYFISEKQIINLDIRLPSDLYFLCPICFCWILLRNSRSINDTFRLRQNGRQFHNMFKCIFLNENISISNKISLKFVLKGPIDKIVSDNGLAPAMRQAIIWNNDGYFTDTWPQLVNDDEEKCLCFLLMCDLNQFKDMMVLLKLQTIL